jgi:thiol:disulfide interchange protein DsbC
MGALLALTPVAAGTAAPDAAAIEARLPGLKVQSVRRSPQLSGYYEVILGDGTMIYVDETARLALRGDLIDLQFRRNLTEESLLSGWRVDFASIPKDLAIQIVKGTGRRQLALIADPDCPYCEQLEHTLTGIDDVTILLLLLPLPDLHPQAIARSHAIWCAADPGGAWREWMLQRTAPPAAPAGCEAPLRGIAQFAVRTGARGTPHLVFGSGRVASGALAREALEYYLDEPTVVAGAMPAADR